MLFNPPLIQGNLIKRYKRFLADIDAASGEVITIHCPNTGSMKNCLSPGAPVWYSDSQNPKRKYRHTWELTTTPTGDLAGINTGRANALVEEALYAGMVTELTGFSALKREVRYGQQGSRADLCLTMPGGGKVFVEVKNVTLCEDGQGYFPDTVSTRARKHLEELSASVAEGHRAALIYCVQHSGISSVKAAAHIDPSYARALGQARQLGVELYALQAHMAPGEIVLNRSLPVLFDEDLIR